MSHDVFISHDAKDGAVAEAVCEAIERAGHLCWIAHRDAAAGGERGTAGLEGDRRGQDLPADPVGESAGIGRVAARRSAAPPRVAIIRWIEEAEPPAELAFLIGAAPRLDALIGLIAIAIVAATIGSR